MSTDSNEFAKIGLDGCDLMIAAAVPHNHWTTKCGFPNHNTVVEHEDVGDTSTENFDEDIKEVTVEDLCRALVESGLVVSWISMKVNAKNTRMNIFFSRELPTDMHPQVRQALQSPTVWRAIEGLLTLTWGWGKSYVLRNTEALDLIVIDVVSPLSKSKAPKHFFNLMEREVEVCEVEAEPEPLRQKPKKNRKHANKR